MSTTVTGSPPRGQPGGRTASHRRGSGAQAAPRARRRFRLPRASTTPGKLWLVRAGLVIVCLAWGALATLMVIQHASAAHDVAATDEPLSLDAQQIYQSLADADVTVSTAYLYGRTGPYADRVRYQHDIAVAAADLKVATAASGNSSVGASLSTLSAALPVYTGYVEDGQIYNSLGYPAGGSFIQVASEEMHVTMLPAARSVYAQENAQLMTASAQATGLPLAVITLVAGLAVCRPALPGAALAVAAHPPDRQRRPVPRVGGRGRGADLAGRRPGRGPVRSAAGHDARLRAGRRRWPRPTSRPCRRAATRPST